MYITFSNPDIWQWQWSASIASSLLLGVSVALLTHRLLVLVDRHVRTFAEDWEFEQSRRVRLRNGNRIYRLTEPLVDELCETWIPSLFNRQKIATSMARGGDTLPWRPEEFVVVAVLESLVLFVMVSFFGTAFYPLSRCLLAGVGLGLYYLRVKVVSLHRRAVRRVERIHRRLPYGIELMALIMQAGADFRDALLTTIDASGDHPFAHEMKGVFQQMKRGRVLEEAFGQLSERLQTEEIRELVFAIQKSEKLGTPRAEMFARIAEQMRLKRSQHAEAEAGKATIRLHGPQFVIMIACMVTIAAPFIFGFVFGDS